MKPMIILPVGLMAESEIAKLNDNGLCVVVCKDPSKVKFVDPIPASSQRGKLENAAIKLSRKLLTRTWGDHSTAGMLGHSDFTSIFCKMLIEGTELDQNGSIEEQVEAKRVHGMRDEAYAIGREEARKEAVAKREAKNKLTDKFTESKS